MERNSCSVQEHTRTTLQIIADQGWVLACYFEVISRLLPPTCSISMVLWVSILLTSDGCQVEYPGRVTMSATLLCVNMQVQPDPLSHLTLIKFNWKMQASFVLNYK